MIWLAATDRGYMSVPADSPLDAIRWLRLHFGWKLQIHSVMLMPPIEAAA